MDNAIESLKLAKSYLEEIENTFGAIESGDKSVIYNIENTLNLIKKHIDKAEALNAAVSYEGYDLKLAKIGYFYWKAALEATGKGNNTAAISNLKRVLELDPEFIEAYALLAKCYWATGNKQEALNSIRKAVALDPENIEYKKTLDRMSSTSGILLATGTFKGSWKVLLILAGITIMATIGAFSSHQGGSGILVLLIGGAITFAYWKLKHR